MNLRLAPLLTLLAALALPALGLAPALAASERGPLRHVASAPGEDPNGARVIVKFKAQGGLMQALSASTARAHGPQAASLLAQRFGLPLADGRVVDGRSQVVFGDKSLSSAALAARLAADPDVEYAVPDFRRHALAAPNDPLYAASADDLAARRPVVPARTELDPGLGDRRRSRLEPDDRLGQRRRRRPRHRRALRPPRPREQALPRLRLHQRPLRRRRRRRPRRRRQRPRRLDHHGRPVLHGHRRAGQQLARHADREPARRADEQRRRHGLDRLRHDGAAGARARQGWRLRLGHHRRHAVGWRRLEQSRSRTRTRRACST